MRDIAKEPGFSDTHRALLKKIDYHEIRSGSCWERSVGDFWVAYNPHAMPVETTRGQRLRPREVYVEITTGKRPSGIALFNPDGGMTLSGLDRRDLELKAVFENM